MYSRRFVDMVPTPFAEVAADWQSLRGCEDSYPTLLATFTQLVERDGIQQVLRKSLPALLPGVAAAAFHGVIRTAHAVESGHRGEVAAALAYWAWRWQTMDAPQTQRATLNFEAWAKNLVRQAEGWKTQGALISIRMEEAARSSAYQILAVGPALDNGVPAAIAHLAALAVQCYVASPNFTVLHLVTGLRAIRTLLPWMDDCQAVQSTLMRAFTAAYLAASVVRPPLLPAPGDRTWQEVIEAATASDNDHAIKLVHACVDEAQVYGGRDYLQAARLVVQQTVTIHPTRPFDTPTSGGCATAKFAALAFPASLSRD